MRELCRCEPPATLFCAADRDYCLCVSAEQNGRIQDSILLSSHQFLAIEQQNRHWGGVYNFQLRYRPGLIDLSDGDQLFVQGSLQQHVGGTAVAGWE